MEHNVDLDHVDWNLLEHLQMNARATYKALGESVGLSPPAVRERIRHLEEAGLITGYRAEIDLKKAGRPIRAWISMRISGFAREARLRQEIASMPQILECQKVTGEFCYVMKVATASLEDLEHVINNLGEHGTTQTALLLSPVVDDKIVAPLNETQQD